MPIKLSQPQFKALKKTTAAIKAMGWWGVQGKIDREASNIVAVGGLIFIPE